MYMNYHRTIHIKIRVVSRGECAFASFSVKCSRLSIGRLRKSGGQKIDLISLLLNKFS